jgi:hypothetical protein
MTENLDTLTQEHQTLAAALVTAEADWRALDDTPESHVHRTALAERLIALRAALAAMPDRLAAERARQDHLQQLRVQVDDAEAVARAALDELIDALPTRAQLLEMVRLDTEARGLRHRWHSADPQVPPPSAITASRRLTQRLSVVASDLDIVLRLRRTPNADEALQEITS